MKKKIKYVKVNLDNINIAYSIQKNEWPNDMDYETFEHNALKGNDKNINFIAYYQGKPIGITGVYEENIDNSSLWLDWYCLSKEYRGKGLGKQILLDTIEYCKQFEDIEFFRVESNLRIDRESTNLYLKVMDFIEKYTIEDVNKNQGYYICTKCLKPNAKYVPWNNRYLGLNEHYNLLRNNKKTLH